MIINMIIFFTLDFLLESESCPLLKIGLPINVLKAQKYTNKVKIIAPTVFTYSR